MSRYSNDRSEGAGSVGKRKKDTLDSAFDILHVGRLCENVGVDINYFARLCLML